MESGSKEVVARGKHLDFLRTLTGWEYVHRRNAKGGMTILAVTREARVLLVEQYRAPLDKPVIELPAGLVDAGEDEVAAVRRELEEETGYACEVVTLLSRGAMAPGLTDEQNSIYLASGLKSTDRLQDNMPSAFGSVTHRRVRGISEEGERIVVHEVPLTNVVPWLNDQQRNGRVIDLKVFAGLFFASTS